MGMLKARAMSALALSLAVAGVLVVPAALVDASAQSRFCGRPVPGNYERPEWELDEIHKYVRAMPKRIDARLSLRSTKIMAGTPVVFRVENRGTTLVGLIGEEFAFERYAENGWVLDPASPQGFPKKALGFVPPGKARFCRSFAIPTEATPGKYRISKKVAVASKARFRVLTAEFHVHS